MRSLTEEEKRAAAKALGREGVAATSVNIAERAAVGTGDVERKPSGAAARDLTDGRGYGERRAKGAEKSAEDKAKAKMGNTRTLTDEQKKRYGIK